MLVGASYAKVEWAKGSHQQARRWRRRKRRKRRRRRRRREGKREWEMTGKLATPWHSPRLTSPKRRPKKANEKKDKKKIEYLLHKTNQEQPAKEIKHAQIKSITIKLLMHVQMYLIIAQRSKRSLWPSFIKFNRWDLNPSCSQPGVILEHPSSWHYSDCIVTIQAKPLYLYIDFSCLLVTHLVGYTIVCNGRNGLVR